MARRRSARAAIWLFVISAALVFTAGAYAQIRIDMGLGVAFTEIFLIGLPAYLFLRRSPALINRSTMARPRAMRLLRLVGIGACAAVGATALGTMVRRALGLSAESLAIDLTVRPLSILTLMFALSVLAPLCEELLFRVSIQGALARSLRPATAVFGTSALFAVYHGALERVPEVLVLGLILGTLYRRTGSFWQCVFVHFILNTVGPPMFVVQSQLPTPILIAASVVMVPLAVAALPRAMPQQTDSVSDGPSFASEQRSPRGQLAGISLLVLGALGIETALQITGAFTRLDSSQYPPPGWCRQEWRLQAQGEFLVSERLTLAPGQSPPAHINSIADGAELLSAVVDSSPITPGRDAEDWTLGSGAPAGVRRLALVWNVPITSLQLESGIYWVQTKTVIPVSGLRIELLLDPACGYADAREPGRQRDPVLLMNTGSGECFKVLPRVGFQLRPRTP